MKDDAKPEVLPRRVADAPGALREEPPVVARLVVEIRSDGTRTIARGALEDAQHGERVAIEAHGDSPLQLAIALARSLTQLPRAMLRGRDTSARGGVRGLLGRVRKP